jgi:hypothetical protein
MSVRLAVKRSQRDIELAIANKACASLSNKLIRLDAVLDDQRRLFHEFLMSQRRTSMR